MPMNTPMPTVRKARVIGDRLFIVFMIINMLSTTAIKFCGRYGSDYTIVNLDTPLGTIKRCVAKD